MAFDYKKAYPEFYLPAQTPGMVTLPPMQFLAVRGRGDPNAPEGDYQRAIGLLYGVAFAIKMSKRGERAIEGYFDYVVPPLEGFWEQPGADGIDYARKQDFCWISAIRLPDFVAQADFEWAREEAARKKKLDCSRVELLRLEEGLCVQCMHIGPYDDEPATVARMEAYLRENGYASDFSPGRLHHEIYLSDARRVPPERRKTVLRHPARPL